MPAEAPALTVYYDGACPLCRAEIGHYRSQPGAERICFTDVARADASTGQDLARGDAMARFHVRDAQGRLVSGAAAFVLVWRSAAALALGGADRKAAGRHAAARARLSPVPARPAAFVARRGARCGRAPMSGETGIAVVFGAGGGIGRALLARLRDGGAFAQAIGFSRSTDPAIDLLDEATLAAAAQHAAQVGPLRLVIDATGFLHDAAQRPEKSWRELDADADGAAPSRSTRSARRC